ncbi:MAG: outer membrane protein assembly factor BamA [Nitrospirae bacterium]|nr:outer membrane protein assembly factor BamA [Nitrospirota bacterium]
MKNQTCQLIRKLLCALPLFLVFYLLFPALADASDPANIIRAIEVSGLTRMDKEEFFDLVCCRVGDMLDKQELSKGIRRAFKKGIFQDIQAVSGQYDGGLKLTYIIREIPVVKKINIDGDENVSERIIRKRFHFKEDEDYHEELLDAARLDLIEFYKRKGYPDAEIKIEVEGKDNKAAVDININIEEGRPLIINKIDTASEVRNMITVTEGGIFDMEELDKDIKRIKEHYKKEKYINPLAGPYQFSNGELIIPFYPGPKLEVEFKNNNAFSTGKLEKELPFIENEEVTDESIAESADRMKRLYINEGYYYAQIAAGVEREEDTIKITYIIFEGERVVLKKMKFSGTSISQDAVKRVVPLVEGKPFNDDLIEDSRESLLRFYNALGYLQPDVVEIKKEFQNNGTEINLEFVIAEGPRTIIKSIGITGNRRINTSQIVDALNLKEESPYNVIDIGDARRRVLSLYGRYGYLNAVVEVLSVIDKENASLKFIITENNPSVIGRIILRGNWKTRAKIIKREFTLNEGDPYNADEIMKIKQRLYKLGIFNEVSIDALEPGDERDGKIVKDMLVSIKEGKAGSVEISLGYGDYEQARGSIDISYRNLGGYNRKIGFRVEMSSVEKRYILNLREPWLLNKPNVPLKIFLIREDKRALNIDTREVLYKIDKQSFIAGIEKEIKEGLKAGFDYEYTYVDTKDVQEDVILSKEDTGTLGISSISPSLFYDTRDNPFDPASGSLQGIVVKYASSAFLSETEFIKTTLQSSWYFMLLKPLVFAVSFKGGAAIGFEETEEIPLIERFFLGGRTTVRGYSHDTLGPKGADDNPTGGNIFVLTNWELRYSIGKGFGLVTFLDAGNVWTTLAEVEDELKYTIGTGLRYDTPVGPIRIDYGHKMNKDRGDSSGEVHFSFGHAF